MSVAARALELTESRTPFVHATVVRAQAPASACTGDEAIILPDGSIEGFVGGQCAEGSVRVAALTALGSGASTLLRVLPEEAGDFPDTPGAQVVVNPCLSGGAIEIFLKPVLPPPVVEIVGGSPTAVALEQLCGVLGYATRRSLPDTAPDATAAVVIASHGRDEQESIRRALDAGVPYIALVASPRRGAAVLDEMGLSCCERRRISSPAGLDLGSRTAGEVAVSILAELIGRLRGGELGAPRSAATVAEGTAGILLADTVPAETESSGTAETAETVQSPVVHVDPVCGMSVIPGEGVPHLETPEGTTWFCNPRCRDRHAADLGLS
jgi:xanthine dehydrogenase accessory factor